MDILDEAKRLTSADRQNIYGHPYDDFGKVAIMTQPILRSDIEPELKHALYMCQVKIARLLKTPYHIDSVIDLAGYANTYAMILEKIQKKETPNETTRTTEQGLRSSSREASETR